MGEEHAAAVMEWFPDSPVATKADIDHLREVMDLRFETTATKLEMTAVKEMVLDLKAELHREMQTQTYVILGAISAVAGIATAIARWV